MAGRVKSKMRPIVAFEVTFGRIFVIIIGAILVRLSATCRPMPKPVGVAT